MPLFLCVDCGGSKTSAVISDASGKIVGRALGGPSNFAYLGLDNFITAVRSAVSNALKTCTSPPSLEEVALPPTSEEHTITSAWFGVSGVDSPAAVAVITPALSSLLGIPPGPRLVVANDTHLLAAPIRLHPDASHAVACIAGTGSICVSFKESAGQLQELGRVGGWGWILGDEGGGFHVGREAIRQLMMEHDVASTGAVATEAEGETRGKGHLKTEVMKLFEITDIMEVLTVVHLPDPSSSTASPLETPSHLQMSREKRLSSLSPLVFKAAFDFGDPLALTVLRTCSDILALQIAVLLHSSEGNVAPRSVAASESVICFGGSLVGIEAYRKMVLDSLAEWGHVFRHVEFVDDAAAVGAAGLAATYVVQKER